MEFSGESVADEGLINSSHPLDGCFLPVIVTITVAVAFSLAVSVTLMVSSMLEDDVLVPAVNSPSSSIVLPMELGGVIL